MERTRSAAMALVGMAVTALSGCVAVEPHPAPAPRLETTSGARVPGATSGAVPGQGPEEATSRYAQTQVKEALEAAGSTPPAKPAARATAPVPPPAADGRNGGGAPLATRAPAGPPERRPAGQGADRLPSAPPTVRTAADVCELGETYVQWPQDGPQARICDEVRGR
ncbi:hypothetical protein [Streptomyces sp. NPDC091212]|uniref:hypothetical protein n=1 Tax=Streptomyces sp. NPDC091212 TaxID=3155191 RepID=UPI0034446EE8